MIWIDILLNILASFALATEYPAEDILSRVPFSWNEYIITPFMRITIIFQVIYGVLALTILSNFPDELFEFDNSKTDYKMKTIVFNTLAFLIIFNLINSRKIKRNEYNVFRGISKNKIFLIITLIMVLWQMSVVRYGGKSLECHPLTANEFLICVEIGSGSLLVGLLARILPENLFENFTFFKEHKRTNEKIGDNLVENIVGKKKNILM